MLETLISSKTRIKLLLKFFLNKKNTAYLRGLESEFGESTNAIRLELNRLEKAGMLNSFSEGNKKIFQANVKHPLFEEVHNILLKHIGLDKIVEEVVHRLGEVKSVLLSGDISKGKNSNIIDLVFIGNIDKNYLIQLIEKAEKLITKKIRYIVYSQAEFENLEDTNLKNESLLLWANDKDEKQ